MPDETDGDRHAPPPATRSVEDLPSDLRGEARAVERSERPVTVGSLVADLRGLGLGTGDLVLVHASLSELGWVSGGAPAVVDALRTLVGDAGTVAMPTHSTQYSDPAAWENPAVPDEWVAEIRASMPPYRPAVTPTRGVGAVPECFRTYPDVRRSKHPTQSFAAWGADADAVVADHSYAYPLGERSPLARLYERDATVLMLGTGYDTCTSLHLAEHRADWEHDEVTRGAPVLLDGEREWLAFSDVETWTDDFPGAGRAFERERPDALETGRVGVGTARAIDQRALVDVATTWFGENRPESLR